MGQRTVRFSDVSGKEIPDGQGAQVRVFWSDARKTPWAIDMTEEEARQMFQDFAQPIQRRRRRKTKAAAE